MADRFGKDPDLENRDYEKGDRVRFNLVNHHKYGSKYDGTKGTVKEWGEQFLTVEWDKEFDPPAPACLVLGEVNKKFISKVEDDGD